MSSKLAENRSRKITLVGLWMNLALIALKLAGGLFAGSRALVADRGPFPFGACARTWRCFWG